MLKQFLSRFYVFFPTCQVRVVRFSVSCPARLTPPAFCSTSSAGPQLQPQLQAPDRSGPRRTSTASSGSEWSLSELNRELRVFPPDFNHKESPKIYQIECQKECQYIYIYMYICRDMPESMSE